MSEIQGNIVQIKRVRDQSISSLSQLQEGELGCIFYSEENVAHDPGAHGQLYIGGKVLERQEGAEPKEVLRNLPVSPEHSYQSHRTQTILDYRENETGKELSYSDIITDIKKEVFKSIYPVGAIYITLNKTNPTTLFGGRWTQIKDRFLLAASESYPLEEEGGNDTHSHDLSSGYAEIVQSVSGYLLNNYKTLPQNQNWSPVDESSRYSEQTVTGIIPDDLKNFNTATRLGGTTDSVSNLPPYLAVYMWQRTEL